MYSREIIYEYLLNKKKELDRKRKLHDKQLKDATAEQQERDEIARENELQAFIDAQVLLGLVSRRVLAPRSDRTPWLCDL